VQAESDASAAAHDGTPVPVMIEVTRVKVMQDGSCALPKFRDRNMGMTYPTVEEDYVDDLSWLDDLEGIGDEDEDEDDEEDEED
jgi:hypothetical protein